MFQIFMKIVIGIGIALMLIGFLAEEDKDKQKSSLEDGQSASPIVTTSKNNKNKPVIKNMSKERKNIKPILMKEKKIKDVSWGSDKTLRIGVFDDGSDRSGYAEYVCLVLADNGLKENKTYVKIIDIAKVVQKGEFVTLGETFCK